jgi:hypothetical protein
MDDFQVIKIVQTHPLPGKIIFINKKIIRKLKTKLTSIGIPFVDDDDGSLMTSSIFFFFTKRSEVEHRFVLNDLFLSFQSK